MVVTYRITHACIIIMTNIKVSTVNSIMKKKPIIITICILDLYLSALEEITLCNKSKFSRKLHSQNMRWSIKLEAFRTVFGQVYNAQNTN